MNLAIVFAPSLFRSDKTDLHSQVWIFTKFSADVDAQNSLLDETAVSKLVIEAFIRDYDKLFLVRIFYEISMNFHSDDIIRITLNRKDWTIFTSTNWMNTFSHWFQVFNILLTYSQNSLTFVDFLKNSNRKKKTTVRKNSKTMCGSLKTSTEVKLSQFWRCVKSTFFSFVNPLSKAAMLSPLMIAPLPVSIYNSTILFTTLHTASHLLFTTLQTYLLLYNSLYNSTTLFTTTIYTTYL